MKIFFEGTPQEVLAEMKDYIVRAAFEFSTENLPTENLSIKHESPYVVESSIDKSKEDGKGPQPLPLIVDSEEVIFRTPAPQDPDLNKCQFCSHESPTLNLRAKHERYCHDNVNREPHPNKGKKYTKKQMMNDYSKGKFG